jgi:hypothetical protein
MFKDDSSICRAALHNGIIKDVKGGIVQIAMDKGAANY